jgi:hypothetical protein
VDGEEEGEEERKGGRESSYMTDIDVGDGLHYHYTAHGRWG